MKEILDDLYYAAFIEWQSEMSPAQYILGCMCVIIFLGLISLN